MTGLRLPWLRFTTTALATVAAVAAMSALGQAADPTTRPVTFTRDVAPILQDKCQQCHQPNSIAPMSLITYEDARPWARSMKQRVITRQMPPWHIDMSVGVHEFKNDMSLTDAQIDTIVRWVDAGAPGLKGGGARRAASCSARTAASRGRRSALAATHAPKRRIKSRLQPASSSSSAHSPAGAPLPRSPVSS